MTAAEIAQAFGAAHRSGDRWRCATGSTVWSLLATPCRRAYRTKPRPLE